MNHPLVLNGNDGNAGSHWEDAIALGIRLGTLLQTLVIPLLVAIGVQFAVQLSISIRREANRQLQRHVEALKRDRQRLIEEIKIDLLRTLNKGGKEPTAGGSPATPALVCEEEARTYNTEARSECLQPPVEKKLAPSSASSVLISKNGSKQWSEQPQNRTPPSSAPSAKPAEWLSHQLDRKDRSNIVNEIIYQIQSGSRIAEDSVRPSKAHGGKVENRPGSAEDTAVLRDVHRRNVVARMKTLFEQEKPPPRQQTVTRRLPAATSERPSPVQPSLRHFSSVVNILRRNEPKSSPSRAISASMENLRPSGGGQFLKASSEPPTVIRLRRRIRSQHSLSESVEDILESERFSKRLSQYSISDLLDEEDLHSTAEANGRCNGQATVPYDRVSRGLKTLSTFSLSELLQDEETMAVDGTVEVEPEVVLRNAKPSAAAVPASYRNAVDNIEQILVAENLSKDYWKYSISNLLDFMEEDGGGLVALEEYTQYGDLRQST